MPKSDWWRRRGRSRAADVSNIRQTNPVKRARTGMDDRPWKSGLTRTYAHRAGRRQTAPSNP